MESLLYNGRTPGVSRNVSAAENDPVDCTAPSILAIPTTVEPVGTSCEQRDANSRPIELAPDQRHGLGRANVDSNPPNFSQSWHAPVQLSQNFVSHSAWEVVTENERPSDSHENEEISISPQQVR